MVRTALGLAGLLGALAVVPPATAEGNSDYSVLIISRERLEVATSCEIGVYLNDQLSGRLFQEQSTSFNLPPGPVDVRLRLLPGQAPGCSPGLENQHSTRLNLQAGEINKYRIAMDHAGLTLKRAILGY
ncbi:hypothetical protein PS627_03562 [Pseudomonas fluorescens]|uniref:hypothetical protein n=1 Tax=Pseudomonas fluorescens TaxID=294 RepID=UPI0012524AE2|nr:hypothetical protein [Pseudomonas fluorescens]CAG8869489.1 hypothetical protein PS627_03562 [Pseudomonas fluorescens]VVP95588.1 hypothetical protein PS910_03310 [Pseudomonas fluorescens]